LIATISTHPFFPTFDVKVRSITFLVIILTKFLMHTGIGEGGQIITLLACLIITRVLFSSDFYTDWCKQTLVIVTLVKSVS